jgi:hypothetical protein
MPCPKIKWRLVLITVAAAAVVLAVLATLKCTGK